MIDGDEGARGEVRLAAHSPALFLGQAAEDLERHGDTPADDAVEAAAVAAAGLVAFVHGGPGLDELAGRSV